MTTNSDTRPDEGVGGREALAAIREFIAARDNLEVAPTHNGAVFDAALARHNAAVECLRLLTEVRGAP